MKRSILSRRNWTLRRNSCLGQQQAATPNQLRQGPEYPKDVVRSFVFRRASYSLLPGHQITYFSFVAGLLLAQDTNSFSKSSFSGQNWSFSSCNHPFRYFSEHLARPFSMLATSAIFRIILGNLVEQGNDLLVVFNGERIIDVQVPSRLNWKSGKRVVNPGYPMTKVISLLSGRF